LKISHPGGPVRNRRRDASRARSGPITADGELWRSRSGSAQDDDRVVLSWIADELRPVPLAPWAALRRKPRPVLNSSRETRVRKIVERMAREYAHYKSELFIDFL